MAAVVRNVHQQNEADHKVFYFSFSFFITFQLDWLIISCNSRWKLSPSEFATAARTHLGFRLRLGDRDLWWALQLLLGVAVGLRNVTLQHRRWTSLHVAGWTRLIAAIKFYAAFAFCVSSSFLLFSIIHFCISPFHSCISLALLCFSPSLLSPLKLFYFYISHLHLQLARMRHAQGWRTIRVIYLAYLEQYTIYTHLYISYIYCKVAGLAAIKLN